MTARPDPGRTGIPAADKFHWGFSTLGCAELSLPDICALQVEFGMRELEIRAIDDRTDLPQWSADTGWSPVRATSLFGEQGIHFRVAGSSFKLVGHDEKSRADMLALSAWADSWGASYVRAFGGGVWGMPLTGAEFDQAEQAVAWWQQEKRKRGWRVELLLETHDAFSASGPCRELLARLDEPIGIIWDSHHTWRLADESPRESWSQLGQWVRHVHVKDSIAKPSARHPYTYVLSGDGKTPLAEILDVLRENKFSGCISLEWEKMWHPYLPPLRDALARLKTQPWFAPTHEVAHAN